MLPRQVALHWEQRFAAPPTAAENQCTRRVFLQKCQMAAYLQYRLFPHFGGPAARFIALTGLLLLSAVNTGCRRSAANSQPKGFESPALHFSYPGNWKIANKTAAAESEQITLEGPDNLLIIITAFRHKTGVPLKEFAETVSDERTKNVEETFTVGGVQLTKQKRNDFEPLTIDTARRKFKGLQEKFTLTLLGIDVPHISAYLREQQGEVEVVYIVHGPEKDWPKVSKAFVKLAEGLKARAW